MTADEILRSVRESSYAKTEAERKTFKAEVEPFLRVEALFHSAASQRIFSSKRDRANDPDDIRYAAHTLTLLGQELCCLGWNNRLPILAKQSKTTAQRVAVALAMKACECFSDARPAERANKPVRQHNWRRTIWGEKPLRNLRFRLSSRGQAIPRWSFVATLAIAKQLDSARKYTDIAVAECFEWMYEELLKIELAKGPSATESMTVEEFARLMGLKRGAIYGRIHSAKLQTEPELGTAADDRYRFRLPDVSEQREVLSRFWKELHKTLKLDS